MAIFFDASKKRRWYFRGGAILLYAVLFVTACILTWTLVFPSIERTPIPYVEAARYYDYYYSDATAGKIAITIDDGPQGTVTRDLMDTLERHEAPAMFFLIGAKALFRPELVEELHARGFDIGIHSFTHDPTSHDSERRISLETDTTANLIEHLTSERVTFYRPPFLFGIGIDPTLNPYIPIPLDVTHVLQNGYLPVGSDIDPKDWLATSPEEIISNMDAALIETKGSHILLLHEMPHTAKALDAILTKLRHEGYEIVPLAELLIPQTEKVASALVTEQVRPPPASLARASPAAAGTLPAPLLDMFIRGLTTLSIESIAFFSQVFKYLVIVVLLLVVLRVLLLIVFVRYDHLKRKHNPLPRFSRSSAPGISVLIPAYNEEANIRATIMSALAVDYPKKEIIIIDDGSTDTTSAIVEEIVVRTSPGEIKFLKKQNGGKASALNLGIEASIHDIIVVVDADTVLHEGALAAFAPHFSDPEVGAVSGQVRLVSASCLLEYFQRIEYATGQNVERRAFSALSIVDVVPGAAGAWKKNVVLEAGGFSADTLVEDQDMTLSVLRMGKKVVYEPRAITYTETPQTLANFVKQRLRWTYGTMQCFVKQIRVLRERPWSKMSFVVIPHIFVFSIVLPFILPLVDFAFFFGILTGQAESVLIPFLIITLFDSLYVLWGVWKEPDRLHLVALVPIQRLSYRQLLYYTFLKSVVRVIEGTESPWNKLARSGSTQAFYYGTGKGVVNHPSPIFSLPVNERS